MVAIKKMSYAAEALIDAKESDSPFVPLDFVYGKNFQGPRSPNVKSQYNQPVETANYKFKKESRKEGIKEQD